MSRCSNQSRLPLIFVAITVHTLLPFSTPLLHSLSHLFYALGGRCSVQLSASAWELRDISHLKVNIEPTHSPVDVNSVWWTLEPSLRWGCAFARVRVILWTGLVPYPSYLQRPPLHVCVSINAVTVVEWGLCILAGTSVQVCGWHRCRHSWLGMRSKRRYKQQLGRCGVPKAASGWWLYGFLMLLLSNTK